MENQFKGINYNFMKYKLIKAPAHDTHCFVFSRFGIEISFYPISYWKLECRTDYYKQQQELFIYLPTLDIYFYKGTKLVDYLVRF